MWAATHPIIEFCALWTRYQSNQLRVFSAAFLCDSTDHPYAICQSYSISRGWVCQHCEGGSDFMQVAASHWRKEHGRGKER